MKVFNYVQTNDLFSKELLVLDSNAGNHLTVRKQMIYSLQNYQC